MINAAFDLEEKENGILIITSSDAQAKNMNAMTAHYAAGLQVAKVYPQAKLQLKENDATTDRVRKVWRFAKCQLTS